MPFNDNDFNGFRYQQLKVFCHQVAEIKKTPELINLVGGQADYVIYCRKITNSDETSRNKFASFCAANGFDPNEIQIRVCLVATVLGVYKQADYYGILGIAPDADDATIKQAYRKKAKMLHPDRCDGAQGRSDEFIELHAAYSHLRDPELRKAYDAVPEVKGPWIEGSQSATSPRRLPAMGSVASWLCVFLAGMVIFAYAFEVYQNKQTQLVSQKPTDDIHETEEPETNPSDIAKGVERDRSVPPPEVGQIPTPDQGIPAPPEKDHGVLESAASPKPTVTEAPLESVPTEKTEEPETNPSDIAKGAERDRSVPPPEVGQIAVPDQGIPSPPKKDHGVLESAASPKPTVTEAPLESVPTEKTEEPETNPSDIAKGAERDRSVPPPEVGQIAVPDQGIPSPPKKDHGVLESAASPKPTVTEAPLESVPAEKTEEPETNPSDIAKGAERDRLVPPPEVGQIAVPDQGIPSPPKKDHGVLESAPSPKPTVTEAPLESVPAEKTKDVAKVETVNQNGTNKTSEKTINEKNISQPKTKKIPKSKKPLVPKKMIQQNTAEKQDTAEKLANVGEETNDSPVYIVQKERVLSFLNKYTKTYEERDLNKFKTFFTSNAMEQGQPFKALLPKYQRTFKNIKSMEYKIELGALSMEKGGRKIFIDGDFRAQYRLLNNKTGENQGSIRMELLDDPAGIMVIRLDYEIGQ